jgi:hypothetical protein
MLSIIHAFIKRYPVSAYYTLVFAISWGSMLIAAGPDGFFSTKANPVVPTQFVYLSTLAGLSAVVHRCRSLCSHR